MSTSRTSCTRPRSSWSKALFGPRPAAETLIAELDRRARRLRPLLPDLLQLSSQQGHVAGGSLRAPRVSRCGVGRPSCRRGRHVRDSGGERLEWAALDWNEPALRFYEPCTHDGRMDHPPPPRRRAEEPRRSLRTPLESGASLPPRPFGPVGPRPRSPMDKTTAS